MARRKKKVRVALPSLADVVSITGLPPTTISYWLRAGYVTPLVAGSQGRGSHTLFGITQATGLVVASRLWSGEQGCKHDYVRAITEGFSQLLETDLLYRFNCGETHLVAVRGGDIILGPERPYWVSVLQAYRDVKACLPDHH